MKLIMENWRQYAAENEEFEKTLDLFIEYYALNNNLLLTESIANDIRNKVSELVRSYGMKPVHLALAAMLMTGSITDAQAEEAGLSVQDSAVAAQQIDQESDKNLLNKAQEIKSKLQQTLEKAKGGLSDLSDTIRTAAQNIGADVASSAELAADGYSQKGDTHEFRATIDVGERGIVNNLSFDLAKQDAIKDLKAQSGVPDDAMGMQTSLVVGEGTEVQILVKWSPEMQTDWEELMIKHKNLQLKSQEWDDQR
tara:strand:- start:1035 stop:1793 length:759 start_codon:yes stop_codon:yes gene_type:complete